MYYGLTGIRSTTSDEILSRKYQRYDYNGDGIKDVLVAASECYKRRKPYAAICLNVVNGKMLFFTGTQQQPFTDDLVATESPAELSA
ncbi:MAG: hypothetical protein R3A12_03595 [Ignavibacteria bacterium]